MSRKKTEATSSLKASLEKISDTIQNARQAVSRCHRLIENEDWKEAETQLWTAHENAEYASALTNLTYDFAALNPELNVQRETSLERLLEDASADLGDSFDQLKVEPKHAYIKLRFSIDRLRRARTLVLRKLGS